MGVFSTIESRILLYEVEHPEIPYISRHCAHLKLQTMVINVCRHTKNNSRLISYALKC